MGQETRKIYASSDVDFNETNLEQNKAHVYRCKLDFSLQEEREVRADEIVVHPQQAVDDAIPNQQAVDEERENEQQQNVENQQVDGKRQLCNRQKLNPVERYGVPVAILADAVPIT